MDNNLKSNGPLKYYLSGCSRDSKTREDLQQ
jgi:hypothetical protein